MGDRGPDERELVVASCNRSMFAVLALEKRLEHVLEEWKRDQAKMLELGIEPPRPTLGRVMKAAVEVHRGVAFWDREAPAPTSLRAAR